MTDLAGLVRPLVAEARATNERRLLVLTGTPETCDAAAVEALDVAGYDHVTVLGGRELDHPSEHLPVRRSGELLGTTRDAVVLDCHGECQPNAIGRAVGAVDGSGLLVLLTPPLDEWADRRDAFDESLAVPPFTVGEVAGRFRTRLVGTLREHRGIAIWDADAGVDVRDGQTHPAPRVRAPAPSLPSDGTFPPETYEACLTTDQLEAVRALEALRERGTAVVVEANRGRGKSSAAGLAAGALVAEGEEVLVTAPGYRNAAAVFERARALLDALHVAYRTDGPDLITGDGTLRYARPAEAVERVSDVDALVVDEAASLPVRLLERFLDAPAVAFCTTVHGYEGAGRGFSVRFRARLDDGDHRIEEVTMTRPIRYAAGDPVEVWAFRALLLDARPPVEPLVADAQPECCEYAVLDRDALLADENRLREAFGLLVFAHYRTEPNDLARLLDAPNVRVRALLFEGHVVSVALLAREGGLDIATRRGMYEGGRVRGNMLPDVLTAQLRDEAAGVPFGWRVLRIATHHAARSRGLGSALLDGVAAEFAPDCDWLGVGYGATPELLAFWAENGYRTVHLSTTRNETSGEYSALMLRPTSPAGEALHERSAAWFTRRIADVLADALRDADPDVVRATLAATDAPTPLDLTDREWRVVAAAAFGPGLYDVAPRPFRLLALRGLVAGDLDPAAERLLVAKALQARPWGVVSEERGYVSVRAARRAFGEAYQPLVERYGGGAAREEADRYR